MALAAQTEGVYGAPPPELVEVAARARQLSPRVLAAEALEALADASFERLVIAAPPGAIEHRYVLAQALRALRAQGELIALAPKAKGGARLRKTLEAFGCSVAESARRHQRICRVVRPAHCPGLDIAIAAGALQWRADIGLWSQPGVFSWDRIDPGSAALMERLTGLAGRGADLGCGLGVLARRALAAPAVSALTLIDIDRRAISAARRNVVDPRADFLQADVRAAAGPSALDFVIMNPPFHDEGAADSALGVAFVRRAAQMLRPGGVCRLVANVALPYEAALKVHFKRVAPLGQAHGYKLIEAQR